ncbi:MAG: ATP-grasp domain-containing protein [Opitutales bacterium]|nr:ATP-grasp domain-containing protein [Opitutales bacterium]
MNVLITSAGRRVELTKLFKKAAAADGGRVFCADCSDSAPALKFCDKAFVVARVDSEDYIGQLLDICKAENIGLVVPTIDTELEILAENAQRFLAEANCRVNISPVETVRICADKIKTQTFFEQYNIKCPKIVSSDICGSLGLKYPMFIKPKSGSSSINTFKVDNYEQYSFFKEYVKDCIVQEFVPGAEYTVDLLCDFSGNFKAMGTRQRLSVRSGEVLKGLTVKDSQIENAVKDIAKKLKLFGVNTLQCIKNERGIYFTEINARFGGGAPMSVRAGLDLPRCLIDLAKGKDVCVADSFRENMLFSRFDDCVLVG